MSLALDQMRWQPFPFQLITLFTAVYLYPQRASIFLYALLVATYFYSGLHKLNLGFNNIITKTIKVSIKNQLKNIKMQPENSTKKQLKLV